jgi:hypothetical protein
LQLPSILHYTLAIFATTILFSFRAHDFSSCIDQAQLQPQSDDNRPEDDVSVLGPRQHQFQGIVPKTILFFPPDFHAGQKLEKTREQCCGSAMSILDPGFPDLNFSIPDPGSEKILDPGSESASKNLSICTQKIVSKLSEI